MANSFNVSSLVSKRMVQMLHAKCMLPQTMDRSYSKDFTQKTYTPGLTVNIDIVHQPSVTSGRVADVQPVVNRTTPVTIGQFNSAESYYSLEKRYNMDDEKDVIRYADDMVKRIVRKHEQEAFDFMTKNTGNNTGTPGTEPGSLKTWNEGGAKIDDALGWGDEPIYAAASPMAHVALTDSLKGLQNPTSQISNQYLRARMKDAGGMMFWKSNTIPRHTAGTCTNAGPVAINDASGTIASGDSTIPIDGLSAATATITKSTKLTIANVYAVDPETKATLSYLKEFSVTADATGSGSAIAALAISPKLYGSDSPHQNVSALPANNATVTLKQVNAGVSSQNIIYAKDAFTLVTVPLPSPKGTVVMQKTIEGINIRVAYGSYDGINDEQLIRVDAVWGHGKLREDHANIVHGA